MEDRECVLCKRQKKEGNLPRIRWPTNAISATQGRLFTCRTMHVWPFPSAVLQGDDNVHVDNYSATGVKWEGRNGYPELPGVGDGVLSF